MDEQDKQLFTYRLKDEFDKRYVRITEFVLVRVLVFNAVGLILTGFLTGVIAFFFNRV